MPALDTLLKLLRAAARQSTTAACHCRRQKVRKGRELSQPWKVLGTRASCGVDAGRWPSWRFEP